MIDVVAVALAAGLAAFRLWRAIALDSITERVRRPLWDRGADALLNWLVCPWCAGFWVAGAVVAAVARYVDWPDPWWLWAAVAWWAAAAIVGVCAIVTADGP